MRTLFDPNHISSFARTQESLITDMLGAFQSLRHDVKNEHPWNDIKSSLSNAIVFASLEGYRQAALSVGKTPVATDYMRLRRESMTRASWVVHHMQDWTNRSLQASKKSRLLSKTRANKVAVYESRKGFYGGAIKGWSLDKQSRKEWFTSNAHDEEDICDDNEDDGIIAMDEPFSSGDMAPPAHLYCECSLWLHK